MSTRLRRRSRGSACQRPRPCLADERPVRKRLGRRAAAVQLLVTIAVGGGLAWLKIKVDPPPAGAAEELAEAEKTEGRSRLQTGDRLRVRVDTSAHRCSGGDWREWWSTIDRQGIAPAADDYRGVYFNGICARTESFSARRSG
jgi:hypothetical protein